MKESKNFDILGCLEAQSSRRAVLEGLGLQGIIGCKAELNDITKEEQ